MPDFKELFECRILDRKRLRVYIRKVENIFARTVCAIVQMDRDVRTIRDSGMTSLKLIFFTCANL